MAMHLQIQNLHIDAGIADIRRFFTATNLDMQKASIRVVGGVNGDAFITFQTEEEVLTAAALTGKSLFGQPLKLFPVNQLVMDQVIEMMISDVAKSSLHALHPPEDKHGKSSSFLSPEIDKLEEPPWMKMVDTDDRPFRRQKKSSDIYEEENKFKKEKMLHGDGTNNLKGLTVTVSLYDKDRHSERRVRPKDRTLNHELSRHKLKKDTDQHFRSRERSPHNRKKRHRIDSDENYRSRERTKYSEDRRGNDKISTDRYWMFGTRELSWSPTDRRSQNETCVDDGLFTPRKQSWSAEDKGYSDKRLVLRERDSSWSPDDKRCQRRAQVERFRSRERSWSPEDRRSQERDYDSSFRSRERSCSPEDKRSRDRGVKRLRNVIDEDSDDEMPRDPGFVVVRNIGITVTARDLREFFDYPIAKRGITMKSADQELQNLTAYVKFVRLKDAVKCLGAGKLLGAEVQTDLITPEEFEKETTDIPVPPTIVTETKNTNSGEATASYSHNSYQHSYGYDIHTHPHTVVPATQYQTNPYQNTPFYGNIINAHPVQSGANYLSYHGWHRNPNPSPTNPYSHVAVQAPGITNPYPQSQSFANNITTPSITNIRPVSTPTPRTDSQQCLSQPASPAISLQPISSMSQAFMTDDSVKKQYYIGLWNIPHGTTACGVWTLYGASNGRSLGVLFGSVADELTTGDIRTTAFVVFGNKTDCERAMSIYRCCMEYSAEDVDKFFETIATKDACKISISTKFRIDRVLFQEEKAGLVKSKKANPVKVQPEASVTDEKSSPSPMVTLELFQQGCDFLENMPKQIMPKVLPTTPTSEIVNGDEASKKQPKPATDPTVDSAWRGKIYLTLGNLPTGVTACSIWEMYGGPDGEYESTGVILKLSTSHRPRFAYVGFMDNDKCTEAMKLYKKCAKISLFKVIAMLSTSAPLEPIVVSTRSGKDYTLTPQERNVLGETTMRYEFNKGSKLWGSFFNHGPVSVVMKSSQYTWSKLAASKSPILDWIKTSPMQSQNSSVHLRDKVISVQPSAKVVTNTTMTSISASAASAAPLATSSGTTLVTSSVATVTTSCVTRQTPATATASSVRAVAVAASSSLLDTPVALHIVDAIEQLRPIQHLQNKGIKKIKVNLKSK